MNINSIEAGRRAAASQMDVLAGVARRLRAMAPGDERATQARELLKELTAKEQERAARLLEAEFAALAA